MTKATIYHNPRCSKSRNSLQLLTENGVDVDEVRYLDTPPNIDELSELCRLMGVKPVEIVRSGENLFKELGLSVKDSRSDNEWLEILVEHPQLLERPIVRVGNKAVMGRPPENVLSLL